MPKLTPQWILPSPPGPEVRARFDWLHPAIVQILYSRGLVDPDVVAEFFGERVRPDDPFRMKGVSQAVSRIRQAIRRHEPIAVYGDFDADGVTSTALLVRILRALGADVMPYIPDRIDEGYGLNDDALKWLSDQGVKLVVTVDCGIRAVAEVRYGNSLGLDIIITDHHSIGPELPPALTVVNPRQEDCPYRQTYDGRFDALAGVGVAYKLAQALLRVESKTPVAKVPVTLQEDDLLGLVAIGTVADLMPLRAENRVLVQRGLAQLNLGLTPGVRALAKKAGVKLGQIDSTAIGFRLAPRINAAGRLRSAGLAYDLLMAEDDAAAESLADELDQINRERQRITQDAVNWAASELGDHPADDVILIGREGLNPGIVGLIAGRLKEAYYRPALVAELGEEYVRGSARSVPEFNITQALDQCADLLVRYGGHAAAAGFTVRHEHLPELRRRLNEIAAKQLQEEEWIPKLPIDAIVELRDLDYALLAKLNEMEPTGSENARPLFGISDLLVRNYRRVGGDGSHLKLNLTDGFRSIDAIAFGQGERALDMPIRVDIAAHLDENEWNGRRTLQLLVRDIQPAGRGIPNPQLSDIDLTA